MISIRDISKWYGAFHVLKDCSTEVQKGEVVVVCGPSGSGKSTLIKFVNGLEPFQKGEIVIEGTSVGVKKNQPPKVADIASRSAIILREGLTSVLGKSAGNNTSAYRSFVSVCQWRSFL